MSTVPPQRPRRIRPLCGRARQGAPNPRPNGGYGQCRNGCDIVWEMSLPLDPLAVMADFVDRVAPYDPAAGGPPVAVLGVRTASGTATFTVTDHVARALCRALSVYRDPDDRGRCAECGGRRVDENLHCRDCGRLHGILGEVIADRARRVAQRTGPAGRAGSPAAEHAESPAS